jgi:glycosyltransferase involved in cell wall biosynthesis
MAAARPSLRVLVGVQDEGFNGIETYAEQIAAAGAAAGHEVTLLVTSEKVAKIVAARVDPSIRIRHLGLEAPGRVAKIAGRLWDGVAMRRLVRAVRRGLADETERYDIAHLNRPVLASAVRAVADRVVVGAWFYPHAPLTRVVHTWEHNRGPLLRRLVLAGKSLSYYRGDAAGFAAADRVAAPTTLLAEQLQRQGVPAEWCPPPVQVVSVSATRPTEREAGVVRLVSVSGDLTHPRKNLQDTLAAAARLARPGRRVVVEMIGRNPEALRASAGRLPAGVEVEFPGPLERTAVHRRVAVADALVLPSLYEEWGYVAVEALLLGTPVVTYPVYPFASMLEGGLGVVATGTRAEDLAQAIERVLEGACVGNLADAAAARYGADAIGRRLSTMWSETRSTACPPS